MKRYMIEAVAYASDGRRLNGNTHSITAETQRDAIEIAKSRQRHQVETERVETRVHAIYDAEGKKIG